MKKLHGDDVVEAPAVPEWIAGWSQRCAARACPRTALYRRRFCSDHEREPVGASA